MIIISFWCKHISISLTEKPGIFLLKSSKFSLLKLSINFWISLRWFNWSLFVNFKDYCHKYHINGRFAFRLAKSIYYSYAVRWDGLEIPELNQVLIIAGFYPWRWLCLCGNGLENHEKFFFNHTRSHDCLSPTFLPWWSDILSTKKFL